MAHEEEVLGKAYDSRLMKRLLTYLRPYRWQTGIALGSILLKVGADVLGPYLTHVVIDRYLAPVPGLHTPFDFFLSKNPFTGVGQVALLYVGLLVFSFLLEYLQTYFMQWAGQMVMFDLRSQIFRHLQRMHIGFYDKNPVGRLVTRVTTDVDALNEMFTACVIWFGGSNVIHDVTTIGILAAFIQYAQRFFRPIQDFSEKYNILQSAMASSERIFKLLDTPVEITSPAVTKSAEGPGRIEFDHVWFAYRTIPGNADVGTGALARPAEQSSAATFTPTNGQGAIGIPEGSGKAVQPETADPLGRPGRPRAAVPTQTVPGQTGEPDWVLRNVSFAIEPGETVAIVGHTGAGKTTIISLLMRFYDVQKGAIKIDGVDIKEMDLAELRRRFGVVLQDPFLFTGTIAGNIRLGTAWIEDSGVSQAAEDVNLADFVRSLPGGFEEEVRERGSTLSTGQKQLISFARALAHDPRILILDEATSSVDTETEFRVRDALNRMVEGRTSIIIAHRLSTVQRADKIIVMHKGQVREMGTHQQLLAQRGIYYKLYQLQYKDQEVGVARAPSPATPSNGSPRSEVTTSADD